MKIEKRVYPFQQDVICDEEGCDGKMRPTGIQLTSMPRPQNWKNKRFIVF